MRDKNKKILFLAVFFIILLIPVLTLDLKKEMSVVENRNLERFSNHISIKNKRIVGVASTLSSFESWYSDHLGIRDYCVKMNAAIQYQLGNVLDRRIILGKDGHWYYQDSNRSMLKNYQKTWEIDDNGLKELSDNYIKVKQEMVESGAVPIWMLCVDKETIYPEYFPENINIVGNYNYFDKIITYLKENSNIDIFSTKDILLEYKNAGIPVYNKRWDIGHWNMVGAYLGYLEAMEHIKTYIPEIMILSEHDINFEQELKKCTFMYDVVQEDEEIPIFEIKNPCNVEIVTVKPDFLTEVNQYAQYIYYEYINHDKKDEPVLLIIGNSYIHTFLLPAFSQSFSKVIFASSSWNDKTFELLAYSDADIVLLQTVERVGIQIYD